MIGRSILICSAVLWSVGRSQAVSAEHPYTGRSFFWKGGGLRSSSAILSTAAYVPKSPYLGLRTNTTTQQWPHHAFDMSDVLLHGSSALPSVTLSVDELNVLLRALQTHPPRLIFSFSNSFPNALSPQTRNFSANYPDESIIGFENGNYGSFYTLGDTQEDIFGLHLLQKYQQSDNLCDQYYNPHSKGICSSGITQKCLLNALKTYGLASDDIFVAKWLEVGHIDLPQDPILTAQILIDVSCNPFITNVHADSIAHPIHSPKSNVTFTDDDGDYGSAQTPNLRRLNRVIKPNDPFFYNEWHINDQYINKAWGINKGQSGVVAMVMDTGVDPNHVDLAANLWNNPYEANKRPNVDDDQNGYVDDIHGINPCSNNGDVTDDDGHGTGMAGILAAVGNNGVGVTGINWKAQLVICRFLIAGQPGKMSDAAKCFDYAVTAGVKVISCSYGGGDGLPVFLQALQKASQAGIFIVASSGNNQQDNDQRAVYPSNYATEQPELNMVTATGYTKEHEVLSMCNYGARTVHLGAPGKSVYTTERGNQYTLRVGSSPASPNVAGIVALGIATNPSVQPGRLKQLLQASIEAVPQLQGKTAWGGKINAYNFLRLMQQG